MITPSRLFSLCRVGLVLITLGSTASLVFGQTYFDIRGDLGPTTPSTDLTTPGAAFDVQFKLPTSPTQITVNPTNFSIAGPLASFFYANNGKLIDTSAPLTEFFDSANGGLLDVAVTAAATDTHVFYTLSQSTPAPQVFTGSLQTPTFLNGVYDIPPTAVAGSVVSGNSNLGNFSILNGTITLSSTVPPPPIPEPGTFAFALVGMALVGLFTCKLKQGPAKPPHQGVQRRSI